MENKKLLITMGCSVTEGYGAYDLTSLPSSINSMNELMYKSKPRFHENGWPPRLQKKLKYDTLINLGWGGSSNSHQAKRFYEIFHDKNVTKQYNDVLVVWMLTYSQRISFYSGGVLRSCIANSDKFPNRKHEFLSMAYLNYLENVETDSYYETLFYLKTVDTLCKTNNFKFLYLTIDNPIIEFLNQQYATEHFLNNYTNTSTKWRQHYVDEIEKMSIEERDMFFWSMIFGSNFNNSNFTSPVCNHPNDRGYEVVANKLFYIISDNFPNYLGEATNYRNIFFGDPHKSKSNLINIL